jgi:hypothetical protein
LAEDNERKAGSATRGFVRSASSGPGEFRGRSRFNPRITTDLICPQMTQMNTDERRRHDMQRTLRKANSNRLIFSVSSVPLW